MRTETERLTFAGIFTGLRAWAFGSSRSIPGLDGLRAISVGLVIVAHLAETHPSRLAAGVSRLDLGILGVRVFFVISGYLITTILMKELSATGTISLGHFYFRRGLRLFPAAYLFITVCALLGLAGLVQLHQYDLPLAYLYGMNYYYGRSYALGHLWSLAVEEQFYLLWPLTLRLLGKGRAVKALIGVLIAVPFLRLASAAAGSSMEFVIYTDILGTGCLLALMAKELEQNPIYRRFLDSRWPALLPLIILLANNIPSTKLEWVVGQPIENLAIAALVHWTILHPAGRTGRLLNLPAAAFVGILSYSLYLWQQLFTYGLHNVLSAFPLNLVMMFGAALASYLLVEGPCLRLRARLERRFLRKQTAGVT